MCLPVVIACPGDEELDLSAVPQKQVAISSVPRLQPFRDARRRRRPNSALGSSRTKFLDPAIGKIHGVRNRLSIRQVLDIIDGPGKWMLPSSARAELRANAARVRCARKTQAVITDCASHNHVGNCPARVAGVRIVGTAGADAAVISAAWAGGIIVTYLRTEG